MLYLTRTPHECILIGHEMRVVVFKVNGEEVTLWIEAPWEAGAGKVRPTRQSPPK